MQIIETTPKLKPRKPDAHKGDFGKVCIIGGCIGLSGAPALAGRAALRDTAIRLCSGMVEKYLI